MLEKLFWVVAIFAVLVQGSPVLKHESRESRIVGGTDADITDFPFMASVRVTLEVPFCGGVILNERWVLCSAHCTSGFRLETAINVVVGSSFLDSGGSVHRSSRLVNHPHYNRNSLRNDISLIQVDTPFVFNSAVAPISLPTAETGVGNGIVAGWGYTKPDGGKSNQLQSLNVEILCNENCLSRVNNSPWLYENKICVLARQGQGLCNGDHGAPLFIDRTVIGVVSWGFVPCGSTRPDVLERVFPHRDWILGII